MLCEMPCLSVYSLQRFLHVCFTPFEYDLIVVAKLSIIPNLTTPLPRNVA